jgi:hypothetical protein
MAITGHILQDGGWVNVKIEVKVGYFNQDDESPETWGDADDINGGGAGVFVGAAKFGGKLSE